LAGLKEEGMIFIQSDKTDPEAVWQNIPDYAKKLFRKEYPRLLP